jgi:hypothetical protein
MTQPPAQYPNGDPAQQPGYPAGGYPPPADPYYGGQPPQQPPAYPPTAQFPASV